MYGEKGIQKRRNSERSDWDPLDPLLEQALEVLRNMPTGERIYTIFMQSGATAQFGPLESVSRYSPLRNLITINEEYRGESSDALAHTLIWPSVALHNEDEQLRSWNDCMDRVSEQEILQAQWWKERFGEHGKEDPTDLELWANFGLYLLLNEGLRSWTQLSPHYREHCAEFGAPPQQIDPILAKAYRRAMLGGRSEIGKLVARVITNTETDVEFGPADKWYGRYSHARNRITVSNELRDASDDVLAAVLIHETIHVVQYQKRGRPVSPAECIEREIDAFKAEAQWWAERHGRNGKDQANLTEQRMNNLVRAWLNERLEEFVLLSDGYQEQCLGGVVDS